MLLLDKFFSLIKNSIDSAKTIFEISGSSPPTPSLNTIEGTNKYIYDELQLVNNSILYPCRVEYHTAYDFRNVKCGNNPGVSFFVERNDDLELIRFYNISSVYMGQSDPSKNIARYSFSNDTLEYFGAKFGRSGSYANRVTLFRDLQYNPNTLQYELSLYNKKSSPPYNFYYAIWNLDTSFVFQEEDVQEDSFYYRGFNTRKSHGVEMFQWTNYFNLQLIYNEYYLSLGHRIFVFDTDWKNTRIIFLNNPFLIGEESENQGAGPSRRTWDSDKVLNFWDGFGGYKSYIYGNNAYVVGLYGDIEIFQIN